MNRSTFQVMRQGATGVANVPVQGLVNQFTFVGTIVPRVEQIQDSSTAEVLDVDYEIISERVLYFQINDVVLNLNNRDRYRVIKAFDYQDKYTVIWCATTSPQE